jgi:hypothetical protein
VLEEVIKWVNDEKLANGSIQSNIVFGASMGGLVARFALKDMEDSSIPTQTSLYISHDSPHQGANFPVGYQYMSRHALQQYVQSPLLLFGGEVIMPLFTDGVSPLDYLLIQNTPAARQMLINYIGVNYSVANTFHDAWQTELRFKGYPSMRKIAISNGNHCALTQNGAAGSQLLSIDGNYSTGWLTDILLTVNPMVNSTIFNSLAILTAEPGFLFGILPGGNKIKLDFKVNALPSSGTNQIYKGKITYTKKLLWLIDINVTITDKSFNSPSGMLPYDYYPGGAIETGVRNSASASGGSFWQQTFVKYKLNISTEPSFCFIPAASALDIGLGEVSLDNSDYLKKYNKTVPLVAPKISPFINFTTSYQNSFTLNYDDYFQSTNEHHIYLNLRNANWLAKEIDSTPNNNDTFDCTYMCPDLQIAGPDVFCDNAIYSVPNIAPNYNWTITQGSNLVTMTGNGTSTVTITALANVSGEVIISLILCDSGIGFANKCGSTIITKSIWIGSPQLNQFTFGSGSISPCIAPVDCLTSGLESDEIYASFNGMSTSEINTNSNWQWALENNLIMLNGVRDRRVICPLFVGSTGFKVRAKNACGWSEWVDYPTFEITECPNSYRLSSNTYIVSPNPSDDIVNIELRDANSLPEKGTIISGELFDMLGLSKSKVEILNNKATFSVRGLNKGIYVLKIYINDKVESYQIAVE